MKQRLKSKQWLCVGIVLLAAILLPLVISDFRVFQATLVLSYAIAILGLNILTGFNGQLSVGHGAFFAIGAYTAAILMNFAGFPYWATLPAAALICLVV